MWSSIHIFSFPRCRSGVNRAEQKFRLFYSHFFAHLPCGTWMFADRLCLRVTRGAGTYSAVVAGSLWSLVLPAQRKCESQEKEQLYSSSVDRASSSWMLKGQWSANGSTENLKALVESNENYLLNILPPCLQPFVPPREHHLCVS